MNKKVHKALSRTLFVIDVMYVIYSLIATFTISSKISIYTTPYLIIFGIVAVLNLAFIIYNIVTLIIKR